MLFELLLVLASASPSPAPPTAAAGVAAEASATPALSSDDIGGQLVERLTAICASNPEVERAFVLSKPGPGNTVIYVFIPIFDRNVSDKALAEADVAYRELVPTGPGLELMLLARSTWRKALAGVTPTYVRPKK